MVSLALGAPVEWETKKNKNSKTKKNGIASFNELIGSYTLH